jgi:ketosteroid isomerase-like protein
MMSAVFFDSAAAAADDSRAAALRAAELARFQANDRADARVLGDLLAEDLEYVHSNGDLDSKQSFIESLTSGRRDYVSSTPTIESIRFFGDVAIIRGKARVTVVDGGTSRDLHIGYTDVWVLRDGKWRMTAWRSARLPDSPVK